MSLLSLVFSYLVIWWTVLFAVLPWGNRQPDKPEVGMAYGAPANPNMKKKFIATTIVSLVILAVIYLSIEIKIIDFREYAREMDERMYGHHGGGVADPEQ